MKKAISFICLALLSIVTYAQGGFRVEIRQVFPKSSLIYSDVFNFKREMDNAIVSQSAKLRGNNSNYKLQVTTPSGNETRYIQNIVWMESVNDKKTYHKKTTYPQESYDVATVWKGCSCNADGTAKGNMKTHEFLYRVSSGISKNYVTPFLEKNTAVSKANELYENLHVDSLLVEVKVWSFMDNTPTVIEIKDNKAEYLAYQNQMSAEKEKAAAEKRKREIIKGVNDFNASMSSIINSCNYLKLDDSLDKCQSTLNKAKHVIPDSTFINEGLDILYKDALLNNVLMTKEGKKFRKQIIEYVEAIENDSIINDLLKHTLNIKRSISNKKAK